ncbi:MAG TPA: glucose 1-dehydrogenase [Solirubrobacteraceae bacterium]|nr:glucose 1-dehydrogenase [Solirubrobacteraceae bacterium]
MTLGLEGKVALVTGGASGIGRATALMFGREGARVIVADIDDAGSAETAALISEAGGDALHVPCDTSDPSQVDALVGAAVKRFGRLDCAFNNAGIGGASAPLADYQLEAWNRVLAVNLTGVFLCMQSELRQMVAQGTGAIVNAASVVGVIGYPHLAAYTAAKHGVIGLTRTAALEYARHGIRVNAVCPGWTETPMVMDEGAAPASDPEVYAAIAAMAPMRRLGQPDEIAGAVVWLCSDAASFVTGHPLIVDGGVAAGRERGEAGD